MWLRAPWLEQRWNLIGLALFDSILIIGSYNLLFWQRFDRWAGVTGSVATVTIIWLCTSYLIGRYSRQEESRRRNTYQRIASTAYTTAVVIFAVVVVAQWGLGIRDPRTLRSFAAPFLGACFVCSTLAQEISNSRKKTRKYWKVIASEEERTLISNELTSKPPAYRVRIELGPWKPATENIEHESNEQEAFTISDRVATSDQTIEDILIHKSQGVEVCSLTNWCERHLQRIPPELFTNRWLAQAEGFDLQPGRLNWRIKRFGDLCLGCTLLVVTAPLVALCGLAIVMEDRGPIFYSQIRTGLYGREFRIWKLRSMRIDAENEGARWSERGDNRITRVGHWLRQLRIDELPQLLSVIKGEMSLIGPRPERPDIEGVLETEIPHYRVRHWIRPGLSGWAQVCHPYGASIEDSRTKLSYDLYYLRNASLGLDVLILMKTIRMLATGKGAIAISTKAGST